MEADHLARLEFAVGMAGAKTRGAQVDEVAFKFRQRSVANGHEDAPRGGFTGFSAFFDSGQKLQLAIRFRRHS
jgi:hypothetical protein